MKEDKSQTQQLCWEANVSEIKLYTNFLGFIGWDILLHFQNKYLYKLVKVNCKGNVIIWLKIITCKV